MGLDPASVHWLAADALVPDGAPRARADGTHTLGDGASGSWPVGVQ